MWDNAASVDMKIGFDPVIADYEVGLDTIAECSFCHKTAIVTTGLKRIPPSPMEYHYVLFSRLFYAVKTWYWSPNLNVPKGSIIIQLQYTNSVLCGLNK